MSNFYGRVWWRMHAGRRGYNTFLDRFLSDSNIDWSDQIKFMNQGIRYLQAAAKVIGRFNTAQAAVVYGNAMALRDFAMSVMSDPTAPPEARRTANRLHFEAMQLMIEIENRPDWKEIAEIVGKKLDDLLGEYYPPIIEDIENERLPR